MDNNNQDRITPENTTPAAPEAPVTPVDPTHPAPTEPVQPEVPAQPAVPQAPAAPAFNGLNTSETLSQPAAPVAPTTGAFVPAAVNPAKLQGSAAAVHEDMQQKAHFMRDILHKQAQVPIMIPLGWGEKPGTMHPFGINGYFYYVQKGVMVNVPQQIAQMAIDSFNLDYMNGAELDLSKNEDKQRALSR